MTEGHAAPTEQLVQAVAAPTAYVPAAQAVTVATVVLGQANPAGQVVQVAEPATAYEPGEHV